MAKSKDPSVHYSKFLSLLLRHRPEVVGVELDENGWTDVDTLLTAVQGHKRGEGMDREMLEHVVATNNKKRFEFDETGTRIRARQGHSVKVDLEYEPKEPPEFLYHGTAEKTLPAIMDKGLLRMNRHHVHMSSDVATAKNVGGRHGKPVVLMVRSGQMHREGARFYRSNNGVWLVAHVPPSYLSRINGE